MPEPGVDSGQWWQRALDVAVTLAVYGHGFAVTALHALRGAR